LDKIREAESCYLELVVHYLSSEFAVQLKDMQQSTETRVRYESIFWKEVLNQKKSESDRKK